MTTLTVELTPEMDAIKTRLKATWMSGDYGLFATYLEPGALEFLSRIPIEPGMRILDVACGAGQISIPAARAGAKVTGIDIAANLIGRARARAQAENLDARFEEGADLDTTTESLQAARNVDSGNILKAGDLSRYGPTLAVVTSSCLVVSSRERV